MRAICLPRRNRSSFWAFCSSRLTFFFDHHHFFDPQHNIWWKIGTSTYLGFFNPMFQHENIEGVGNLSKWSSDICSLCWSHIAGKKEFMVDALLAKNRNMDRVSCLFFTFRDKSPCTPLHWDSTCGTLIRSVKNSLIRYLWWTEQCTWIAKNVSLCPRQLRVSSGILWSGLNIDRGLGTTASWLGTWKFFPLQIDSLSWNYLESFKEFNLACNSCVCEVSSCIVAWLSLS